MWCGRKISARLRHLGHEGVSATSTITAILQRHGRITPQASEVRLHFTRFERTEPNDLWQIDFKGEFRMTNQAYCYPLTVLDDHSRPPAPSSGTRQGRTLSPHAQAGLPAAATHR